MTTVAVSGANGFVGRAVVRYLTHQGMKVRALVRNQDTRTAALGVESIVATGDMVNVTDWRPWLSGADAVVHLAARVHKIGGDDASLHDSENAEATRRLAMHAADANVRQFIYLSTIKVNGERTEGRAFTAVDSPAPADAYSRSKLAAELSVARVAQSSSMCATVIRPPLIYGPGVRANFYRLMSVIRARMPLPLGCVENQRSLISVWNLADLIRAVIASPRDGVRTFLAADPDALSTPELIRRLGRAMERRVILVPVPVRALRRLARILCYEAEMSRLTDSLVVDCSHTCGELGWRPPLGIDEALLRTVSAFLQERTE